MKNFNVFLMNFNAMFFASWSHDNYMLALKSNCYLKQKAFNHLNKI
jgi:hypothetical protein